MQLSDFTRDEAFTSEDAKELLVLLSNKSLKKAIGRILTMADNLDTLTSCDLVGQEGLAKALGNQGTVRGMRRAIEELLTLSQHEDNEDD